MENKEKSSTSRVFVTSFFAGGIAGVVAKTIVAPIERMKIIFLVSHERFAYKAMFNKASDIYKNRGIKAFWRGNTASIARIFPLGATQFAVYDALNNKFTNKNDNKSHKQMKHFIFGATGGVCASLLTYPLEFLRVRMAMINPLSNYTMTEMIVKTVKLEGATSFFRGIGPALVGVVVYKGNGFMFFEYAKPIVNKYTNQMSGSQVINNFFSGAFAGLLAQCIAYPFDVIKKKYQSIGNFADKDFVQGANKKIVLRDLLKKIIREEGFFRGFYKGLSINIFKGP